MTKGSRQVRYVTSENILASKYKCTVLVGNNLAVSKYSRSRKALRIFGDSQRTPSGVRFIRKIFFFLCSGRYTINVQFGTVTDTRNPTV